MRAKRCPICGLEKSADLFYSYFSKSRQKYRISNYCIECGRKSGNERAKKYYAENRETRKQKAKEYRENPLNVEKIKLLSKKFKIKYREELQACYVRDRLKLDNDIPTYISRQNPELVETKRLLIKIKHKLNTLNYGKE